MTNKTGSEKNKGAVALSNQCAAPLFPFRIKLSKDLDFLRREKRAGWDAVAVYRKIAEVSMHPAASVSENIFVKLRKHFRK